MRSLIGTVAILLLGSCGPRQVGPIAGPATIAPPGPAPPGSTIVYGPLRVESVEPARSDVGWDCDFARGSRVAVFDVVLAQERAACPNALVERTARNDEIGCRGLDAFDGSCKVEPVLRARVEVEIVHTIDLSYRCAGDAATYVLEGDSRASLTTAAKTCFRNRNKLKPEASWTSLYELTELRMSERVEAVRTSFPVLLGKLLRGDGRPFCRDDGAYLDGNGGVPPRPSEPSPIVLAELLGQAQSKIKSQGSPDNDPTPLTGDTYKTEHAVWEQCNGNPPSLVARERCLLLRQLDKFLRDVEDLARPDTPKASP